MEAKIDRYKIDKDENDLITNEEVLIKWNSSKGFGELYFKTQDGKFIVDAELMSFDHIVEVLRALPNKSIQDRITKDFIVHLSKNEIFVFGSNLSGIHGGGAAKTALDRFGAVWGLSNGRQGNCYAIPTKSENIERTLTIEEIKIYVNYFIEYAKQNPEQNFLVTEIGCGLAGHYASDIAPLFKEAVNVKNIHLPKKFWNILI